MALILRHASDLGRQTANWSIPSHSHTDLHEMVLVADGRVDMDIRGQSLSTRTGWVKFHPAGVVHAERAAGGKGPHLLILSWQGGDTAAWPLHRPDPQGRIATLLRWLIELCQRPAGPTRGSAFAAVLAAYAEPLPSADDGIVEAVRTHVAARMAEPIYLADLARVVSLSPFHFARRFRRGAGCSPMDFVRRQRVERVRVLLLTTAMPLRAIAPLVGFGDEFQLSRVFRQVTGQVPTSLRSRGRI
jgi:AraC-like DNA-binding protein